MPDSVSSRRLLYLMGLAVLIVLVGSIIASLAQTSGGTVKIRDVRFMGSNGIVMSGLLYVPVGVNAKKPAPGIVAIHGYINSRETQDGFAIEFARRGFVVLALDQTGHGYSDPPAFANGFGGPDGLKFLKSLDIVDPKNIGMEGHSMGGWASDAAAGVYKDDYQSIIFAGSATGVFGTPEGTATFPRNMAVVFGEWDEFSTLMWTSPTGKGIVSTDKLKKAFGTTDTVEVGKLYGSIADGTARKLYLVKGTHPNNHISSEAIADAIEWFQTTLKGGNSLPPYDQVWYWREIGGFLGFIGMILFLFPLGAVLLQTGSFKDLAGAMPESKALKGNGWWIGAALTIAIPIISYYWLQHQGNTWFPAGSFWPQNITTGLATWAVGNGLITLVLFLVWHFTSNRAAGATTDNYGLTWEKRYNLGMIVRSFLLAVCIAFGGYLLLLLADGLFKVDFRLWVLALKPMSLLHFQMFLAYLLPFTFFFLVSGTALNGQLRQTKADGSPVSMRQAMLVNAGLLVIGFIILLLVQYIPLMTGGTLPLKEELLTIVAFQFVPLMIVIALISTYFFRKTGHIYVGAFLNALFITAYIVAGQATHFAF